MQGRNIQNPKKTTPTIFRKTFIYVFVFSFAMLDCKSSQNSSDYFEGYLINSAFDRLLNSVKKVNAISFDKIVLEIKENIIDEVNSAVKNPFDKNNLINSIIDKYIDVLSKMESINYDELVWILKQGSLDKFDTEVSKLITICQGTQIFASEFYSSLISILNINKTELLTLLIDETKNRIAIELSYIESTCCFFENIFVELSNLVIEKSATTYNKFQLDLTNKAIDILHSDGKIINHYFEKISYFNDQFCEMFEAIKGLNNRELTVLISDEIEYNISTDISRIRYFNALCEIGYNEISNNAIIILEKAYNDFFIFSKKQIEGVVSSNHGRISENIGSIKSTANKLLVYLKKINDYNFGKFLKQSDSEIVRDFIPEVNKIREVASLQGLVYILEYLNNKIIFYNKPEQVHRYVKFGKGFSKISPGLDILTLSPIKSVFENIKLSDDNNTKFTNCNLLPEKLDSVCNRTLFSFNISIIKTNDVETRTGFELNHLIGIKTGSSHYKKFKPISRGRNYSIEKLQTERMQKILPIFNVGMDASIFNADKLGVSYEKKDVALSSNLQFVTRYDTAAGISNEINNKLSLRLPEIILCCVSDTLLDAGNPNADYLWNTGEKTQKIRITKSGIYSVTVTNGNSLVFDSSYVKLNNRPVLHLPDHTVICRGEDISLNAGGENYNYMWSTGANTTSIFVYKPGLYFVDASNECGTTRDYSTVLISDSCNNYSYKIPEMFTPNADGKDDNFHVEISDLVNLKTSIFNLSGIKIFESNSVKNEWDGNICGKKASQGYYYYVIYAKKKTGDIEFHGKIMLKR